MGQNISVANEKLNIFYALVDNPVSIAVNDIPANLLHVESTFGKLTKYGSQYTFHSDTAGYTEIVIFRISKNKKIEIGRRAFRIYEFPLPIFKIGSGKDSVSIAEVSHQQYVRADLENFDIDIRFKIEKFTVWVISNDSCKTFRKLNIGGKLNSDILDRFQELQSGEVILFRDILVSDPAGRILPIKETMLKIY